MGFEGSRDGDSSERSADSAKKTGENEKGPAGGGTDGHACTPQSGARPWHPLAPALGLW